MKQPHLRKKTAMTDAEVSRLNRSRSVLSDTATYRKDNEDAILSRSNRSQSDMSGLPTKGMARTAFGVVLGPVLTFLSQLRRG